MYELKLHQFELCKELIDEVASGYIATGAMMQFDNNSVHIAVRLQCQESLDCGIIAATSSDRAATWNKVILRDEKGGPVHVIYPVSVSKTSGLEPSSPLTHQPLKEYLGIAFRLTHQHFTQRGSHGCRCTRSER